MERARDEQVLDGLVVDGVLRVRQSSRIEEEIQFADDGCAIGSYRRVWIAGRPLAELGRLEMERVDARFIDAIAFHAGDCLLAEPESQLPHGWSAELRCGALSRLLARRGLSGSSSSNRPGVFARIRELQERDEVLLGLVETVRDGSSQPTFAHDAAVVLDWNFDELSDDLLRVVVQLLRHVEGQRRLRPWLESLQEVGALGPSAAFLLAEVHRDQGRWQAAEQWYTRALALDTAKETWALLLSSRGEARIWQGKTVGAAEDLESARERLADSDGWAQCNVLLKSAIVARVLRMPVRAATFLVRAQGEAERHGFRTEMAKVQLELGLVAAQLGALDEARERIEAAKAVHQATGYVKGVKKAAFCLGHVHELADRCPAATSAYQESLELNRRPYDRYGMYRCHDALARTAAGKRQREAHRAKAREHKERLKLEDKHAAELPTL